MLREEARSKNPTKQGKACTLRVKVRPFDCEHRDPEPGSRLVENICRSGSVEWPAGIDRAAEPGLPLWQALGIGVDAEYELGRCGNDPVVMTTTIGAYVPRYPDAPSRPPRTAGGLLEH